MQPCGAGIIAVMKLHFKKFQLKGVFDSTESETNNINQIYILLVTLAFKSICNVLSRSAIQNCWQHTVILFKKRYFASSELKSSARFFYVFELVCLQHRIDIDELIIPVEDEKCVQGIDDGGMLEESQDEQEKDKVSQSIPTFSAQVQAIAVLRQVLYVTDDTPPRMLQNLRVLHTSLCQNRALKARQTTIDTFLNE